MFLTTFFEFGYTFQVLFCSRLWQLVKENGEALTKRALNTMLLFGEVVDLDVEGVVLEGCVVRSVSYKVMADGLRLSDRSRQALIHLCR